MKRIALLIFNTNGLEGTKADVGKLSRFLMSLQGGAWEESEIFPLPDLSRKSLLTYLKKVRQVDVDYAIVMFSGHGGYRNETVLEINQNEETITVSDLLYLAPRQLSIFDCCRVMEESRLQKSLLSEGEAMFSSGRDSIRTIIRKKYNARILQSMRQQAVLYACSVGECSYDSKSGAVYIDKLIEIANNASDAEFMTVGQAHQKAARLTTDETSVPPIIFDKDYVGPQYPEAYLPKCLSSQQLVISINPSYYYSYG
jgi:hypothetical protein